MNTAVISKILPTLKRMVNSTLTKSYTVFLNQYLFFFNGDENGIYVTSKT